MNDEPAPWQTRPRFSRKFGCLLVGVGLPLLMLLMLVAIYMIWVARANRRAERALAAIREAGEPVDASELNAFYALPEGADDVTQLWLFAMRPFEGPEYQEACEPLPIVGSGDETIPPPGKPWEDLEAVEAFLAKYAAPMAAAHKAAERGGAARYPVDFSQGWDVLLRRGQQARALTRMLVLEAQVRAHRGDWPGAVRSIRDMHRLAESLKLEPCLVSQLVRYAIDGIARGTLQDFMQSEDCSVDDLASLQQVFQSIDYSEGLERAMLGERAMGVSLFQDTASLRELFPAAPAALVNLVPRGDDLALLVEFMSRHVEAARVDGPERLREFDAVDDDIQSTLGNLGPVGKVRYMFSALTLPAVSMTATVEARGTAGNRAAAAVIAAERFRKKHGRLPKGLEELVPEFLPEVPVDPFTGEPMKVTIEDDKLTVYSVGENGVDERGCGGRWDGSDGDSDDVAFPMPQPPENPE
jgi:hypothetical protein